MFVRRLPVSLFRWLCNLLRIQWLHHCWYLCLHITCPRPNTQEDKTLKRKWSRRRPNTEEDKSWQNRPLWTWVAATGVGFANIDHSQLTLSTKKHKCRSTKWQQSYILPDNQDESLSWKKGKLEWKDLRLPSEIIESAFLSGLGDSILTSIGSSVQRFNQLNI